MNPLIQRETTILPLLIPVALVLLCFALSPMARAAGGPPTNCNTSEGNQAL